MADLLLELFSEEIPARMQRQAAEDLAAFRHHGEAEPGDILRRLAGDLPAGELNEAFARSDDPRNGLEQRRLAGTIGAGDEQRLALVHLDRGLAQGGELAIANRDAIDGEEAHSTAPSASAWVPM